MTTENASSFHDESTDDDLMDNAELAAADTRGRCPGRGAIGVATTG